MGQITPRVKQDESRSSATRRHRSGCEVCNRQRFQTRSLGKSDGPWFTPMARLAMVLDHSAAVAGRQAVLLVAIQPMLQQADVVVVVTRRRGPRSYQPRLRQRRLDNTRENAVGCAGQPPCTF